MAAGEHTVLRGQDYFTAEEILVHRVEDYPGGSIHAHDFLEIVYIERGQGIHRVGDRTYRALRGDVFIVDRDVPHGFSYLPGRSFVWIDCLFRPAFLDRSLAAVETFAGLLAFLHFADFRKTGGERAPPPRLRGVEVGETEELFHAMLREYEQHRPGCAAALRGHLTVLLTVVFRLVLVGEGDYGATHRREVVRAALRALEEGFHGAVRLDELAYSLGLSRARLGRLFRTAVGEGPKEYLQRLRVNEACRLLRDTDLTVAGVAERVGYADSRFFYDVFERHTGLTPGEFRNT